MWGSEPGSTKSELRSFWSKGEGGEELPHQSLQCADLCIGALRELLRQTRVPSEFLSFFLDRDRVHDWWIQSWTIEVHPQHLLGHTMEMNKLELHHTASFRDNWDNRVKAYDMCVMLWGANIEPEAEWRGPCTTLGLCLNSVTNSNKQWVINVKVFKLLT